MTEQKRRYENDEEVEKVVLGFESCTLSPSDFDHGAHLTVALYYLQLSRLTTSEAAERMRASLYRYLTHNRVDRAKYNETITLFWINLVHNFLARAGWEQPLVNTANTLVETFGNSQLIFDHYSKERLSSDDARKSWVEPDVKPLDF